MLKAEEVKRFAREFGADLVGIGSMDRFAGAPKEMDPRYIFPDAKAIIGLGFRIPRGLLRGIEEGTEFYQYPAMGYANINENFAPMVLHRMAGFLEDEGYEACLIRNTGALSTTSDMTGDPHEPAAYGRTLRYSEPVAPDRPAPNVQIHFRIAAFICGLGEIGYSKVFLTPQFGPRQRFAFILTDAPLEPDPLFEGKICDRCMHCVAACPGHAIDPEETVQVNVAGREVEWGKLSEWQCFSAYTGGIKEVNPFLPPEAIKEIPDGEKIFSGEKKASPEDVVKIHQLAWRYFTRPSGYNPAMCGGRGCIRACMVHLEQTGKLSNRFQNPFRKRKPWKL